jgi:hypothetical protein
MAGANGQGNSAGKGRATRGNSASKQDTRGNRNSSSNDGLEPGKNGSEQNAQETGKVDDNNQIDEYVGEMLVS